MYLNQALNINIGMSIDFQMLGVLINVLLVKSL